MIKKKTAKNVESNDKEKAMTKYTKIWNKNLDKFKLEKSINWKLAIVKKIKKFSTEIETEDNLIGQINFKDISWTQKDFKTEWCCYARIPSSFETSRRKSVRYNLS